MHPLVRRRDKCLEQWMRRVRLALEFRMKLASYKVRVTGNLETALHDIHQPQDSEPQLYWDGLVEMDVEVDGAAGS